MNNSAQSHCQGVQRYCPGTFLSEGAGSWLIIPLTTGIQCLRQCRTSPVPFLGAQGAVPTVCAARWLGFNLVFIFFPPASRALGSRELQGSGRFSSATAEGGRGIISQRGWALALLPRQPPSPRALAALGIAPFAARLGGNAGGLLLLSAAIFRARRGFWQRCQPAHAAPSTTASGKGWQLCQGCGLPGVSPLCHASVHSPPSTSRAGLGRAPRAVPCHASRAVLPCAAITHHGYFLG